MRVGVYAFPYTFSHGVSPRGFGSWCFSCHSDSDLNNPLMVIWIHQMTYTAAKKSAVKKAKVLGWEALYVQP